MDGCAKAKCRQEFSAFSEHARCAVIRPAMDGRAGTRLNEMKLCHGWL